jgi:hypothetical protein
MDKTVHITELLPAVKDAYLASLLAPVGTFTDTETREGWLNRAASALAERFNVAGHPIPPIRISIGFPIGVRGPRTGNAPTIIGQCWPCRATEDGVPQVFISPVLTGSDPVTVLGVLAHQMCHAALDTPDPNIKPAGHGKRFADLAQTIGLKPGILRGKPTMKAAMPGEPLRAELAVLAETLGPLPHGAITPNDPSVKKQTTRMIKVWCTTHNYVLRTVRSTLDEYGCPFCPGCLADLAERAEDGDADMRYEWESARMEEAE